MSSPDSELSEEETSFRSSDFSARSSPADGPFAPGHVVAGRYRMINIVGKGGMGEVFPFKISRSTRKSRSSSYPRISRRIRTGWHSSTKKCGSPGK